MPHESRTDRLAQVLAKGPFALALRLAVDASGLTLDRLQAKLADRGVRVSKTALSYWQQGRTQPERAESLQALGVLEEILGLPERALRDLVGPPRPRGRWLTSRPGVMGPDRAWARPDGLSRALAGIELTPTAMHRFTTLAAHITGRVDTDLRLHMHTNQLILRAEADRLDRVIRVSRTDAALDDFSVTRLSGCRLGRQQYDEETGFRVFELLLDRVIDRGELVVVQYDIRTSPPFPDNYHRTRVSQGMRTFSLQLGFDAPPARVYRMFQPAIGVDPETTDVHLDCTRSATLVAVDPPPGLYGLAWDPH